MDGQLTDEQLLEEAREFADQAYQHDRQNRIEAERDLEYLAGNQWDEVDRQLREQASRPVLTINRLIQPVKQVINDIRQAVPSVKVTAVDKKADKGTAAVLAGLIRQIQRQSKASRTYAIAAGHAASCGIGHFRVLTTYVDDGFDQEVQIKLIPHPLSVLWDPASTEPDRSDARKCLIVEHVPKAEFKRRYPKAKENGFDALAGSGIAGFSWQTGDTVVIAEYWRKIPEIRRLAQLQDGRIIDMTDLEGPPEGEEVVREREFESYRVEQVMLSGSELLAKPQQWAGRHIPIVPVIGNEIPLASSTVRHGIVRFARDPQRMYNYWRSSAAEWIGQGVKSPWLATSEMIGPHKEMWDTANTTPRPFLLYTIDPDNPQARPTRQDPPSPPAAFWQEGNITSDEIKATTGLYDASLGARSNEVSGRAIMARQSEGDIANYEYTDNLKISLQHAGRIILDLVPRIYDTSRIVRVLDEEEKEDAIRINQVAYSLNGREVLVYDLGLGKYDVTLSIGQSQTTRRREAADSMLEFMKLNPDAFQIASDLVVEAMDWPGKEKLARRFRNAVPPQILGEEAEAGPPQPDPMQQKAIETELAGKAAEVERTKGQARLANAKAVREEVEATMQQQIIH